MKSYSRQIRDKVGKYLGNYDSDNSNETLEDWMNNLDEWKDQVMAEDMGLTE